MQENKFDSGEEEWFSWALDELARRQFIEKWERAESFTLSEAVSMTFIKPVTEKHKKERRVEKDWVSDHIYTPDFKIWWSGRAHDAGLVQVWSPGGALHEAIPFVSNSIAGSGGTESVSYIEVKPQFDAHGKTQWSSMQIKWVMAKFGLHVQMVKVGANPKGIFDKTFTPNRFLLTDKTLKPRSIKYHPKTLDDYIAILAAVGYRSPLPQAF